MKERHKNIPASYLVLQKDEKVLLLRRFNTGHEDGKYSLVAGHVDAGESFTHCAVREAQEEAGVFLNTDTLQAAHMMHRNAHPGEENERIDLFFTATEWEGEITNMEPHKCDDLSWFSLNELPENILPYIKQALECIRDGVFYSEHGWK